MEEYLAAVVQMDSTDDRRQNLRKMMKYIDQAAEAGAKLIVFPETADYIGEEMQQNAWSADDAKKLFSEAAARHGMYIHCGSITAQNEPDRPYNMTLFFAPDGRCMGSYEKLHMFDVDVSDGPAFRESAQVCEGRHIAAVRTELGTIGMAICYDIRFGEMFRLMALAGAQLLCISANFTAETGRDHWETLLRARAIENGCYVLAADQTGVKPSFTAYGNSMIIDPWGKVIARSGNREEVVYAGIDLNYVNQVRSQIPSLDNRRKDLYQLDGRVIVWE